jgi:HD-like signal output (HDOD) protein
MNMQAQTPMDFVEDLSRRLSRGDLDLPSCPQVALRIRDLLKNEDLSPGELAKVSLLDPILTGRIISVANSAMFSRSLHPTTEIRAAIARIGFDMVRNLAFEVALDKAFDFNGSSGSRELIRSIRTNSRQVGALAHFVAKRYLPAVHADEAMLAGLLHEVGKLYILARADDFPALFGDPLTLLELLHDWHASLGHAILDAWGLPASVVTAVGEQDGAEAVPEDAPLLMIVLRAAIALNRPCQAGADGEVELVSHLPALRFLDLDEASARGIVKQACSLATSFGALFG